MCNVAELNARKKALKRVQTLINGLCDIKDVHAREIVIAELKEIFDGLEQVIELKLQAGGDNDK